MIKGSQLRMEREDFEQVWNVYQQKHPPIVVPQQKSGANKNLCEIVRKKWVPERLLLLRFWFKETAPEATN